MRSLSSIAAVASLSLPMLFVADAAHADPPAPDGALALFTGAGTIAVGFTVGATLLATSKDALVQNNVGWLVMQSGFAIAPLSSHAVAGEWTRGLAFASVPTAALAGNATLFALVPGTIDHGTLPQQRVMWSFFGAGLFSAAIGVVDAALAPSRARAITLAPALGAGQVGLQVGGVL